jgi:hypothetical protein
MPDSRLWRVISYGMPALPMWSAYVVAPSAELANEQASRFVPLGHYLESPDEIALPVGALIASRPLLGSPLTVGEWVARQTVPLSTEPTEGAGQARLFPKP